MNRDWLEKDFYRLLEVGADADRTTIKKAYRRLAQKLHPDANPDDPNAAERFKQVSEAYSVLSDDERRREYDQVRSMRAQGFGAGGFGPGGGGFAGGQVRIEDLLSGVGGIGELFNFGRGARGPQRGADLSATLDLTFEQSVRGATRPVSVSGASQCGGCSGSGAEPGTAVDVCGNCGGTGTVASNQGFFSFTNPCPVCGGGGRSVESPCVRCDGSGQEISGRTIRVRIPPGVKDGNTIRLRGRGAPGPRGGPPGDLLVRLRVGSHPRFSRKGGTTSPCSCRSRSRRRHWAPR